jgi:Lon protease-like protein
MAAGPVRCVSGFFNPGRLSDHIQGKIRIQEAAHDAHPGRRHLPLYDDAVRGGPRIQRARPRRSFGRRQEDFPRHPARRLHRRTQANEIYQVGTIVNIVQSLKLPDGNIKVLVEGIERGKILQVVDTEGFMQATVRVARYATEPNQSLEAAMQRVTSASSSNTLSCARH